MPRKTKILRLSLIFTIISAVAHFISLKYFLYWRLSWFDTLVHVVAGMGVGCLAYWLGEELSHHLKKELSPTQKRIVYLSLAIAVSIGWEFFEYYFHLTDARLRYALATGKDVVASLSGVLLVLYLIKEK